MDVNYTEGTPPERVEGECGIEGQADMDFMALLNAKLDALLESNGIDPKRIEKETK